MTWENLTADADARCARASGSTRWAVLGRSFGARWREYALRHPDNLSHLILDGPVVAA
jgi:proline iminopeptidase